MINELQSQVKARDEVYSERLEEKQQLLDKLETQLKDQTSNLESQSANSRSLQELNKQAHSALALLRNQLARKDYELQNKVQEMAEKYAYENLVEPLQYKGKEEFILYVYDWEAGDWKTYGHPVNGVDLPLALYKQRVGNRHNRPQEPFIYYDIDLKSIPSSTVPTAAVRNKSFLVFISQGPLPNEKQAKLYNSIQTILKNRDKILKDLNATKRKTIIENKPIEQEEHKSEHESEHGSEHGSEHESEHEIITKKARNQREAEGTQ
ncbi:hypothetical protein BJX99DRAFT_265592 [Aspergillus californicus]